MSERGRICPVCENVATVSEGGRIDEHVYGPLVCDASGWNYTARQHLETNGESK